MPERADTNSKPHRLLERGDRGRDVRALQVAVNLRLKRKGAVTRVRVDGEFGPKTADAFGLAAYLIGLPHRKPTRASQALVRSPWRRNPAQVARGRRHLKAWKRHGNGTLAARALKIAHSLVGVMEQGGNNAGPMVSKIIRANGGTGPEPWCGDFVAYCYRLAGSKSVTRAWAAVRFLGFVTGMKVTSSPKPGAIVCYSFSHTGLLERFLSGSELLATEGNTGASGAVSDSATGGDGVYRKRRPRSLVTRYVRVLR